MGLYGWAMSRCVIPAAGSPRWWWPIPRIHRPRSSVDPTDRSRFIPTTSPSRKADRHPPLHSPFATARALERRCCCTNTSSMRPRLRPAPATSTGDASTGPARFRHRHFAASPYLDVMQAMDDLGIGKAYMKDRPFDLQDRHDLAAGAQWRPLISPGLEGNVGGRGKSAPSLRTQLRNSSMVERRMYAARHRQVRQDRRMDPALGHRCQTHPAHHRPVIAKPDRPLPPTRRLKSA